MAGKVTIIENGRDGQVLYHEGPHTINGYWEFGGNDVVTIVSMGDRDEWRNRYPWALDRRSEMLRFVADEVIRMRAPTCTAAIDEASGTILESTGAIPTAADGAEMKASGFVKRYSKIEAMVGIGVLALVLIAGAVLWMGKKVLMVAPANGVPLNECVRTEHHIASFIQYTDRTCRALRGAAETKPPASASCSSRWTARSRASYRWCGSSMGSTTDLPGSWAATGIRFGSIAPGCSACG